jgi:hypothetical protein
MPHATHVVLALLSWSVVPAGQRNQEHAPVRPAATNTPAGHTTHGVEESKSTSTEPAGHETHGPKDCKGMYVPGVHGAHAVAGLLS